MGKLTSSGQFCIFNNKPVKNLSSPDLQEAMALQ